MRDQMNLVHPVPVIAPVVVTTDTPQVGAIIDRRGYESLTYIIQLGTLADADATVAMTLQHGDESDLSDGAAVTAADLAGTLALAGATFADDGECRKVGYVGAKRYTRLTATPSNNTGNLPISAIALLGNPANSPTPNPPQ